VNDPIPPPSLRPVLSRRAAFLIVVSFLAAIVWAAWPLPRTPMGPRPMNSASPLRVRDVYADSPFKNSRPGVAYVGDAACTRCHREIARAYHSHPMGRSLTPVGGADEGPPTDAAAGLPFESQGVQYTVERRDRRVFHKATRRDAAGSVLEEFEAEVRFALGSGTRGTTFLIERDGLLFQSPIAWFAQKARWDISPGYGDPSPRPNFERAIQPECLYCHTNQLHHVPGTLNRYEPPIFEGHAIGCERCHGPGELHVKQDGPSAESDLTIVNPANLAPARRESVCQQCHLQGWFRFPRAGREFFDFRPGLPLHRFLAVFVRDNSNESKIELVGQVEQMESSRCFRASQGKLGCISCHDPHRLPEPSAKAAYYRERCLACHERKGCALPSAERQARGQGDDCVACHLPRPAVKNLPHTAGTDHRIPRGAPGSVPAGVRNAPELPGDTPMRDFHWGLMTEDERRDAARDVGVGLAGVARILLAAPQLARNPATRAMPLLEAAVRDRPDDLPARESLGYALEVMDRPNEALRAYEEVLRIEPGRETTLSSSARVLIRLERPDLARLVLEKTIALNPWRSDYRLPLAGVCRRTGDWPAAIAACREAIRINPELFEARSLLIQCYLWSNQPDKAEAELQILFGFYPASREVWQRWYDQQKQAAPGGGGSSTTGKH
jgi:Tetratricopeptide repeat/Doubled CXXCH motif (Paired_CXXCH_1)